MRKIEVSRADLRADVTAGPAPMLQWIEIENLVVDDGYQRDLKQNNWKNIRKIAAEFSWSKFSPVFVAPVEGGAYAIIDGQHRSHAAAMCGFKTVPCQIVQMTRQEQAAAFAAVNGVVTQVTPHQLLKAALSAGEDWAVNADAIAREAGCHLMTFNRSFSERKPGEIYGMKGFLAIIESRPRGVLIAALRLLKSAEGYGDSPEIWASGLFNPFVLALTERAPALANPAFRAALEEFDFWEMADQDENARRIAMRTGNKHPPRTETLRAGVLEWIDRTFPARMALPQARQAEAAA